MAYLLGATVLGVGYHALAEAGATVQLRSDVQAVWWPMGWAIGYCYLAGLRYWPGVLVADFLPGLIGTPALVNIVQTMGNVGELLIVTLLARRLLGPGSRLSRPRDVIRLLLAIAVGTAFGAWASVWSLLSHGDISAGQAVTTWQTWWLGDVCGAVIAIPLILAWRPVGALARRSPTRTAALPGPRTGTTRVPFRVPFRVRTGRVVSTGRVVEAAAAAATVLAGSLIAFGSPRPLAGLALPGLIWAALRFGQPGGTLAVAVTAVTAVGLTARHRGPFLAGSIDDMVLAVQLHVLASALIALFLGAAAGVRRAVPLADSSTARPDGHRP